MRVAHYCDSRPGRRDGVSTSASLSVRLLREAGHHVRFFHPAPARDARKATGMDGTVVPSAPIPFRDLRLAPPGLRLDPGPVDVVHAHTLGPIGMAGFRLARDREVPLVVTWHTDLVAYADHFPEIPIGAAYCARTLRLGWTVAETLELASRRRRRERLLDLGRGMMRCTSHVVAPSGKTATGVTGFGVPVAVSVLRTPVILPDDGRTRDDVRARLGIAPRTPVVLAVGRVTAEKNPELLVRAFGLVRERVPGARLVVLGARQGVRPVRALIRELGLTGDVLLVPPVPRRSVAGYYRAADVLAFASVTDTQSLVLAEAESQGLPVVLTDRVLAADTPWRTCVEPAPAAFAAAITRMLTDEAARERARAAGLAAHAAYSADDYLTGLVGVYRAVSRR